MILLIDWLHERQVKRQVRRTYERLLEADLAVTQVIRWRDHQQRKLLQLQSELRDVLTKRGKR